MTISQADADRTRQSMRRRKIRENIVGYLYIAPVLLGILIFTAFPVIYAFVCSLFDVRLGEYKFVNFGLQNYLKPFQAGLDGTLFWNSLKVTFKYALINIPLTLALSFALAVFLNQKLAGMRFFRTLYYLPVLIPAVCYGLIWKNITNVDFGIGNVILEKLGLPPSDWFSQAKSSMPSFIFIGLFGIGGSMIMWLAQLKNVPQALYESARLDGANYFVQLFRITIPMCSPMIFYNLIMSLIGTLQMFTQVSVLTGGSGEEYSLNFYVINIYNTMFNGKAMGYASALSFILFFIIGLLTLLVFKTNKWVYYGDEG